MQADLILCDACGLPISADELEASLVRVGSCEFPFRVHPVCRAKMDTTFDAIAAWCELTNISIVPESREELMRLLVESGL